MARVLIVGGGCRGRELASALIADGHAVRVTTRTESGRAAIERSGAECFIGDPDRLATLVSSLEHVTIACWMLGCATGAHEQLTALHSYRLERFLAQAIDTTVRGFVYEACGTAVSRGDLAAGERVVRALAAKNAIPVSILTADPAETVGWLADARASVGALLDGARDGAST